MTKKSSLFFTGTIIMIALFIGCTKATVDTTAPVINITAPTDGQEIMEMGADSSTFSVHITDADLHAYSVLITNADVAGDTLLNIPEKHQEINDLTVTQKFPIHVVTGTVNYKAVVTAEDHNGNEGEATRNFKVKHM